MTEPSIADIVARLRARAETAGVRCVVAPPLPTPRLAALAHEVGGLPSELMGLLAVTTGLELGDGTIDFASCYIVAEAPPPPSSPWRLFPRRLELGASKDRGRYLVDLGRSHADAATVFALWPDPPVLRLVAPSIGQFLVGIARAMPAKGDNSLWDFAPLRSAYKSKADSALAATGRAPSLSKPLSPGRVRQLADPVLFAYAARLPARTWLWDVRQPAAGSDLLWSGHRAVAQFHRHPSELIFGLTIPARWWRPTAAITGRPSGSERRRWKAAFKQD